MANIDRLREAMTARGVDSLLVSQIDNVQWATGFTGSNGFLLVSRTDSRFITDSRYTLQAREQLAGTRVEIYNSGADVWSFIGGHAKELGITRLGFESDSTSYATHEKMTTKFAAIELVPVDDIFSDLRAIKTSDEISKVREACKLADACFDHVKRMIQPGVSEYDIGLDIEFFFRRQGAGIAFEPVVVSGERSALPHGRASEKRLQSGDFLTLDFGCRVDGYCSDITRTVVVAELTPRHEEIYSAVLNAQNAALEAMKPGVPAKEIDRISREQMGDLAQYFGHGLGHGLGRLVHDAGRMSASSENILQPGQIWTVEPGIYIPSFGGCRIEDDVVVTESGIENFTLAPKELMVIG